MQSNKYGKYLISVQSEGVTAMQIVTVQDSQSSESADRSI